MSQPQDFLTTRAFAEKAGVSAGTVSKWLRSGKIDGHKKNGKWLIAGKEILKTKKSHNQNTGAAGLSKSALNSKAPQPDGSVYSVEAFTKMTYLTEFGVRLWLKNGRLISALDDMGREGIASANLEQPHIKHLLR